MKDFIRRIRLKWLCQRLKSKYFDSTSRCDRLNLEAGGIKLEVFTKFYNYKKIMQIIGENGRLIYGYSEEITKPESLLSWETPKRSSGFWAKNCEDINSLRKLLNPTP